ncbi:DUF2271 domain-containing protein [Sphingomonas sp. G-3-2-10]|uniref:DUF2271 domain-containing protein n=1 Tax=Sphingomonas sp. G-3-2-10 TaxID=2728838 RepID=UPI00146B3482|nr:DUF2271 domain-containing protein [Sphingomonas sp. G-3-2-10]NML08337.1 DUF2271 domain-containing protein [Sphingomonas sp. G-3-2-10]
MEYRLSGIATAAAIGAGALVPGAAAAQTLDLSVTIPQLKVAEYHRPYVAVWIQKEGGPTRTLAVWYDQDAKEGNKGTKWLTDIRTWWRASGRTMKFPADGISSATKAPGTHKLSFAGGRSALPNLSPGKYFVTVEASREVGGLEKVRLEFVWDGSKAVSVKGSGSKELGAVSLTLKR